MGREASWAIALFAFWALSLGACNGCHGKSPPEPDARAKVTLDADSVRVDGVRVASRRELAPRAPTRLTPLFDELKAHREAWKTAHPGQDFPSGADLVLAADATCIEVENLLRTLAYAAYPHIVIDPGDAALNVDGWVPGPPPMDAPDADPPLPMQVHFRSDGKVALSRTCTGTSTIVEASAVPSAVVGVSAPVIRFGCDEGVRFSAVRPTLAALRKARVTALDSDDCAVTVDGGAPTHVLNPNLGLGGDHPLLHRPGVLGETIVTTQGIDSALAEAALAPRLPRITACFEDKRTAPSSVPSLGAYQGDHETIELTVAGDGGVALVGNGGFSREIEVCLGQALASITFPPFDAATAKVSYGFVFRDAVTTKPPGG